MSLDTLDLVVVRTILSFLDNRDLQIVSELSKAWREKVDNCALFTWTLRGDCRGRDVSYQSHRVNHIVLDDYYLDVIPVLKYPKLMRTLTFKGDCTVEIVRNFIRAFPYVTAIYFDHVKSLFNFNVDILPVKELLATLKKLTTLEIDGCCAEFNQRETNAQYTIFNVLTSGAIFPKLRHFFICYRWTVNCFRQYFKFINRHSTTLESIRINCLRASNYYSRGEGFLIDIAECRFSKLKELEVVCLPQFAFPTPMYETLWQLVTSTEGLERLTVELNTAGLNQVGAIISKSKNTLKYLSFRNIVMETSSPYSIPGLHLLTELLDVKLDFLPHSCASFCFGRGTFQAYHRALFQQDYPTSLRSLTLVGVNIMRAEIMRSLLPLVNLTTLTLNRLGANLDFTCGVDHCVFHKIVAQMPQVKKLTLTGVSLHSPYTYDADKLRWERIVYAADNREFLEQCDLSYADSFGAALIAGAKFVFDFGDSSRRRYEFASDLLSIYAELL